MLIDFLLILLPLFVVVDPAGSLPVYLSLTERYTEAHRRRIAKRATVVAAITGVSFIIVGQAVMNVMGVSFADFQIAGGLLVVILAIVDILSAGKPAVPMGPVEGQLVELDRSVGIIPLAVPLIVGPATMATSLLLVNTYTPKYSNTFGHPLGEIIVVAMVIVALLINLAVLFAAMWYSQWLVKLLGKNFMAVMNKIVMILLAAIAVSLIRQGIVSIVTGLSH